MSSRFPSFYRLPPAARLEQLESAGVIDEAASDIYKNKGLTVENADLMVENVISVLALPCAVAVNFVINDRPRIIPMVVEEPSVVAAVSHMAKLARKSGGFHAEADPSIMIGQVQLRNVGNATATIHVLQAALPELRTIAANVHPRLSRHGGGLREMKVRHVVYDEPGYPREDMVVLHFHLDCADAMGANMINTVAETLAPHVSAITGEVVGLRILSNLADQRLARAWVELKPFQLSTPEISGEEVIEGIASAWRFAWADPYRAATHNKGVMNGIDAVAVATGNDWRAIEAGAHAWAARDGQYRPMTTWRVTEDGNLRGSIELPMQFGAVGGALRVHPTVQSNLKMLNNPSAREIAAIAVSVGLAQNLGALRALATEGIQAGHMRMHARTLAGAIGARGVEVTAVTEQLVQEKNYSTERASEVLNSLRHN